MDVKTLEQIFEKERASILEDYFSFLRFASIATDPAYQAQTHACADWLIHYLKKIGLEVEVWKTEGSPVIFDQDLRAGSGKETLLLYGHYDVQPVDPLELWESPPFEPTVRNGNVYARGAADNKGQCFYTISALKTLLAHLPQLPVNLKLLIEGEEESGSQGLAKLLPVKAKELRADHLLIVDAGIEAEDKPSICLGARGITCLTVTLTGSHFDLHSGTYGGIAYNPNRALVELLASLHDKSGKVTIPGFYKDVKEVSEKEKSLLELDCDVATLQKEFGITPTGGEEGFSPFESAWLRPSLEINGLSGGYGGAGFKTVIPAKALAKLSCRLVADQDPHHIAKLVKDHLERHVPKGVTIDVFVHPGLGAPFRASPHSKIVSILSKAYTEVFQKPCGYTLLGGSIPISTDLAKVSEGEMIMIGVGLPGDQIHSPNEHFSLKRFLQGYLLIARAIQAFNE